MPEIYIHIQMRYTIITRSYHELFSCQKQHVGQNFTIFLFYSIFLILLYSSIVFTFLSISTSAKEEIKKKSKHPQDNRLSRREFRQFLIIVVDNMPGADSFEYFIEFLNNSVEVSTAHTGVSCVSFTLNFYSLLIKNFLIPL